MYAALSGMSRPSSLLCPHRAVFQPPRALRFLLLLLTRIFPVSCVVFPDNTRESLDAFYDHQSKAWPYVGSPYVPLYSPGSSAYYNSLAVFPNQLPETRFHGTLGVYKNGTLGYKRKPLPLSLTADTMADGLKNGGFYAALSDALPLDRDPKDARSFVCRWQRYHVQSLGDVSVVMTFYNEHLSVLLRSVHSILNYTPPPLLREIILVDDHSNVLDVAAGGVLESYITLLPKVKLVRLPERRGLVHARLTGARIALAATLVFLDSHIEVNRGWLEPQLQRLNESPKSIVFPQIPALASETFAYNRNGIGCRINFQWSMRESSEPVHYPFSASAIPSPSMAGGIFSVHRSWFWQLGGYDEQFSMWGAENVEMGFRAWMCGGRLECTPCSYVYHIYRTKGSGYSSPPASLWKNKLRTARLWVDSFFPFASLFVGHSDTALGSFQNMQAVKHRLKCRNFSWYLNTVAKDQPFRYFDHSPLTGQIRSIAVPNLCVDTLSHKASGRPFGVFYCHEGGGTQGFVYYRYNKMLYTMAEETLCLASNCVLDLCTSVLHKGHWELGAGGTIKWVGRWFRPKCLTLSQTSSVSYATQSHYALKLEGCQEGNRAQAWSYSPFVLSGAA